jgi:hypothetical protein
MCSTYVDIYFRELHRKIFDKFTIVDRKPNICEVLSLNM